MKLRWKKGVAGEQRGAFIVFTAVTMWFLMMFVAFAVDFGNFYRHRSQLQNAADAAALAGVAKYATGSEFATSETAIGKGRLIKIPTEIKEGQAGQEATFSSDDYTFTKLRDVPRDVHRQGTDYVHKNYRDDLDIKDDSIWTAIKESTSSTTTQAADGTAQTITTETSSKLFCYRVDLEDVVPTFFARIFGVETLPVRVSAMAMLDGTTITTVEDLLQGAAERINETIPNYYWESLANYITYIKDTSGNTVGTTAAPKANPKDKDEKYGKENVNYLISDANRDYSEVQYGARDGVIGYTDRDQFGNNITDGICAEPIYAQSPLDKNDDVLTQIFRFEKDSDVLYHDKEIVGLLLDRDNVTKRNKNRNEYCGAKDRFVEIFLGRIRGKYDERSGKFPQNPKPIYVRLESEPVQISNGAKETENGIEFKPGGVTTVCGIWINVNLTEQIFLTEGEYIKPFIFAYDGPDPNRGAYDAPWIPTKKTIINIKGSNKEYRTAQIRADLEPVLARVGGKRADIPDTLVQSSQSTPGPIFVHIGDGCVFKGIIWAPRSKVKITGGGIISGFIAARRIDDSEYYGPHAKRAQEFSMPTLAAYYVGPQHDRFDYTRDYIVDTYTIVYTGKPIDYTRQ